jgi:DNA polymerase-3 subunit epsilon
MQERYVAFDVETPNYANDRISAIGITVVENGSVSQEFAALVNPETAFSRFHIGLTGITPEMVVDQPTFPVLWEQIEPLMGSGLLIAHNAPFDLSVLAKCLRDYGIQWHPYVQYACTCQMSRRLLPQLPNHKLDTLCDYLQLHLQHHQAGSDSRACGEILIYHLQHGAKMAPFIRTYDLQHIFTVKRK